jgi:hypothetical protein
MILADSEGYAHGGEMSMWPVVLLLGLLALVVLLIVLIFLWRYFQQQGNRRVADGGQPLAPPVAPPSASQFSGQSPPSSGGPVRQALPGDYMYCEDTILDALRQKGRPMAQTEICEDTELKEHEVAGALAFMEERGMVKRTWDRGQSTYIVEAT